MYLPNLLVMAVLWLYEDSKISIQHILTWNRYHFKFNDNEQIKHSILCIGKKPSKSQISIAVQIHWNVIRKSTLIFLTFTNQQEEKYYCIFHYCFVSASILQYFISCVSFSFHCTLALHSIQSIQSDVQLKLDKPTKQCTSIWHKIHALMLKRFRNGERNGIQDKSICFRFYFLLLIAFFHHHHLLCLLPFGTNNLRCLLILIYTWLIFYTSPYDFI